MRTPGDRRLGIAGLTQPVPHPAAAAGGVHSELGWHRHRAVRITGHPGDVPIAYIEPVCSRSQQRHVRQGQNPLTHPCLKERPGQEGALGSGAGDPVTSVLPPPRLADSDALGAGPDQILHEPGEKVPQDQFPRSHQPMRVPALRHPLAGIRAIRQVVTVQDRDLIEPVRQDPRGQQPSHAGADHHRAPAGRSHLPPSIHPALLIRHHVVRHHGPPRITGPATERPPATRSPVLAAARS